MQLEPGQVTQFLEVVGAGGAAEADSSAAR